MKFDKNYYISSSISNYVNYTNKKFDALFEDLCSLPISCGESILDFGCATGGLINVFNNNGYKNVKGTDISYWAINYGRKQYGLSDETLSHYNRNLLEQTFDFIFFLDVLEHIPSEELGELFSLVKKTNKLIVRIPVSKIEGEDFVLDVSKNDKTHIQIHSKEWWMSFFSQYNFNKYTMLNTPTIYESEGVFSRVLYR
jgi:cyclopropane fatty-acyl-phospholipid synthase-like methyltransferase